MDQINCPSCGATNPIAEDRCQSCDADLTSIKSVINTANRHYNRALELGREDKTDEAIRELETALELWDDNANYYNVLGTCYAKKGDYAQARQMWQKSLALNPAAEKAHRNIEQVRKLDPEEEQPVVKKSGPLPWIVAAVFLLVAAAGIGYAVYVQGNNQKTIAQLEAQNQLLLEDKNDAIADLKATADELESRYASVQEDRDAAQKAMQDLRQAMEVQLSQRDQQYITRQEHQKALQDVRQESSKKESAYQQQITAIRQQAEKEKADLNTKITQLSQDKEQLAAQMNNLRSSSSDTSTRVAELQTQLDNLRKERENLDSQVIDLHQDLQAAQSAQEQQVAELERLEAAQQKSREEVSLLTSGLRQYFNRDYDAARETAATLLEKDSGSQVAQLLASEAERMEAEWNDPLNVALRQQRSFASPTEEADLRSELASVATARSRTLLEQRDYAEALKQAQLAVELAPQDPKAAEALSEVQAVKAETDTELQAALEEAQQWVRDGQLFQARSLLRQTAKDFPHNEQLRSTLQYVETQAADRNEILTQKILDARPFIISESFEEARSVVEDVLNENPANEAALAYRQDLNAAFEVSRQRQIAEHLRAAREAMTQGNHSEARRHVEQLLEIAPNNAEGLRMSRELETQSST